MQRLKTLYKEKHGEIWELIRYVVAGVLTTAVSVLISYGMYILLSEDHTINGANAAQTMIGTAGRLGRRGGLRVSGSTGIMVFRVQYTAWRDRLRAFVQFAAARVLSFLLFEQGLFQLLKLLGVENTLNRVLVLVLVIVFNYVASKFWIFKKNDPV